MSKSTTTTVVATSTSEPTVAMMITLLVVGSFYFWDPVTEFLKDRGINISAGREKGLDILRRACQAQPSWLLHRQIRRMRSYDHVHRAGVGSSLA